MKDDARGLALQPGDALVIVDVQKDRLPGGAWAVHHGDEVVPVLNAYITRFCAEGLPVFATRNWHPRSHCSFQSAGGRWPPHCIAGTPGAAFAAELALPPEAYIISKGHQNHAESYSGFAGSNLADCLRDEAARRLFVGGLATDYCVLGTVKDALVQRFEVVVLTDAVRALDVQAGDGAAALARMQRMGARMAQLGEILEPVIFTR